MLTIHHQPERLQRYNALRPFQFDQELGCWCVFDKDLISTIFRSPQFHAISYADHYRAISERTSIDFDAITGALDLLPLANEGETHKSLRNLMAGIIGKGARENIAVMESHASELAETVFRPGRSIDLVADLATPLFEVLFELWLGASPKAVADVEDYSQVFDRSMSLNRRKKLNARLDTLSCAFARQAERLKTDPAVAVAMSVVGNDAFIGSIALSIWHHLAKNPGSRLCDLVFPDDLPSTSVPYIERIATEDAVAGSLQVKAGERVRLFIDATTEHVSGGDAELVFGKGRHLCLGKPMTLVVWRALTKAMSKPSVRYTMGEMKLREGDYVFAYPQYAKVDFYD